MTDREIVKMRKSLIDLITGSKKDNSEFSENMHSQSREAINDNSDALAELGEASETNSSDNSDALAELGKLLTALEGRVAKLEKSAK